MGNNAKRSPIQAFLPFYLFGLAALALYGSSLYSYILFHSLIEIVCVVAILTIFVLAWNAREILDNHYILFLGISFLSTASLQLIHLFAYKGFGVFPGFDTNLPTQLWIAFRYVFSLSFLLAPAFIARRLNTTATLTCYVLVTALLFVAIFSGAFPDCFLEGKGLTPFKIYSEFVVIGILLAALAVLLRQRRQFDVRVLRLLACSIISAVAADISFTRYFNVYGAANLIGHFFLFLSAFLIYRAIVVTGVSEPMAIIFRNLEQSEERLRLIAETSTDLLFQLDVTGKVVFCSPAVNQYGYSVAEVMGQLFTVFVAAEDHEQAAEAFQQAISGTHIQGLELRVLSADGSSHHVEINIAPIVVNGVLQGLQGISRDITARREAEKKVQDYANELQIANTALNMSRIAALNLMQDAVDARAIAEQTNEKLLREMAERKQAEEAAQTERLLLQTIVNHLPAGIDVIRGSDLRIQFVNPAYQAIAPGKEMVGKTLDELWPETQRSFVDLCRRVLATGEPHHAVNELNMIRRAADGPLERGFFTWSLFRVRLPGDEGWAILNTTWETTESMLVGEKLKESEALYRGIGESIDYGVWVCLPDGRSTYVSESFLAMAGLPQEQCTDFGWGDRLHPEDADRTLAVWRESVRSGEKLDIEHRIRGVDDQWHHILTRGVPIRNEQGEITCWAGINLDISGLKQAEELIRASLAEKEVLLREIHHRVKNNLQVISSLVSLQATSLADERMQEIFGDVRDRVRTMALVHEKLYLSGNMAQLSFADYAASLLQYLWRMHGALAEKIRLNLAIDSIVLPVETAVPCGLILNELTTNALKHAFPNGRPGTVTVGMQRQGDDATVSLWVRDNGIGLPSGHDWRQSSSLGLRLVQILAGQLRGSVITDTGANTGTEFNVSFLMQE